MFVQTSKRRGVCASTLQLEEKVAGREAQLTPAIAKFRLPHVWAFVTRDFDLILARPSKVVVHLHAQPGIRGAAKSLLQPDGHFRSDARFALMTPSQSSRRSTALNCLDDLAWLGGLGGLGAFDNRRTKDEHTWRPPVDGNGRRGCLEGKATNSRRCQTANNFAICDISLGRVVLSITKPWR